MFFKLFCRAPRMRITGLVAMLMVVVMTVVVTVRMVVIVRVPFAMMVSMPVIVCMAVRVYVIVRLAVVMAVVTGLARCMIMPTAGRCSGLGLFLQQVNHAFSKVGVCLRRERINHWNRFKAKLFERTQQGIGGFLASRKFNKRRARFEAHTMGG
jgi:hypothetical protein